MSQDDFEINPRLLHFLSNRLGWRNLNSIQRKAIPSVLNHENTLILAPTASGKTEAALAAAGYDPSTIPTDDLNTSYDVCLLQNLDADLFIIGTYGINDRTYEDAFVVSEERAMDRTTIYGAYNYVLDKLYTAKPTAKVIILGQHLFTWENTEKVNEIQQKVAARWGIPFADWGHRMSINSITKSTYTSDGVHPNTAGIERLGNFLYEYLIKDYCIY